MPSAGLFLSLSDNLCNPFRRRLEVLNMCVFGDIKTIQYQINKNWDIPSTGLTPLSWTIKLRAPNTIGIII